MLLFDWILFSLHRHLNSAANLYCCNYFIKWISGTVTSSADNSPVSRCSLNDWELDKNLLTKQLLLLIFYLLKTVLGQCTIYYIVQELQYLSLFFSSCPSFHWLAFQNLMLANFPVLFSRIVFQITTGCYYLIDQWTNLTYIFDVVTFKVHAIIHVLWAKDSFCRFW